MGTATDGPSGGKAPPAEGAEEPKSSVSDDGADDQEGGSDVAADADADAADEEEDDGEEPQNPYLNKMVAVVRGKHRGIRGRIVDVAARGGWWTVDHHSSSSLPEEAEADDADDGRSSSSSRKKVKNSDCRMIDAVDPDELTRFCHRTGTRLCLVPPVSAATRFGTGSSSGSGDDDCDDESAARKRRRRGEHPDRDGEWKHTRPPDGVPPSWRDWRESMPPHVIRRLLEASVPPAGVQYRSRMPPTRRSVSRGGDSETPPLLPPVTISPDDDTVLPEAVRHLPPDSKVDIFDRGSGRILTGADAVMVRDLAAVLRSHAEYEPVVPPPSIRDAASASVREGRSGHDVTVSASVRPQVRTRSSAVEGREVIVTGGRLRGRVGRIKYRLPGNWYVVSDLLLAQDDGEMEYVISSAYLDLLGGQADESESQPPDPDAAAASGTNA